MHGGTTSEQERETANSSNVRKGISKKERMDFFFPVGKTGSSQHKPRYDCVLAKPNFLEVQTETEFVGFGSLITTLWQWLLELKEEVKLLNVLPSNRLQKNS